ncbi:NADH-ubiquinone oxidoreductase 21.3 kDa subunit [Leucoagaricus sp. SymC.cos]|nr:NADH-ubiquinone oxidoreductase 21.3 kDa subunit [Leucoagaricus sp. SymC.cos]
MADSTDVVDTQTNLNLYETKPTLNYASRVCLQAAAVGTFVSTVQNALSNHSRGAMGFLTRTGGTIGFFGAMGFTFAFTESYVANLRQKDDPINGASGACAAGFLAGVRSKSLPMAIGGCVVLGAVMGGFDYAGHLAGQPGLSMEEKRKKFFKPGTPLPSSE